MTRSQFIHLILVVLQNGDGAVRAADLLIQFGVETLLAEEAKQEQKAADAENHP